MTRYLLLATTALALAACATTPASAPTAVGASTPPAPVLAADYDADRQAILSMLGEYEVSFDFQETVALRSGYQTRPAKHSGANEVVILVEDAGDRIVLQHLLVSRDGHVTKHWRQDWHYQATERFEFTADQTWRMRAIDPASTRGAWTQCVFEVSDAPRYCGTGRFNHKYGVATWTSDRSWRPLPRREYTTREDYNALNVENRHTMVPGGWTHEQDNTKVVRRADGSTDHTLVREFGFNNYRKVEDFDFGPAYRYWDATQGYWAKVRALWQARFDANDGVHLKTEVDGMPVIVATFTQAGKVEKGEQIAEGDIQAVFDKYVLAPSAQ
ncbi:DUF6607 family protein [Arenimonas donghaensis]|uniref:Secreted protein n=1 Tax=Arenimonas donghaensis DSM 18148 = HO3-R19 TaxID=1121014 RepID=A0A087MFV2_9GAMM|nr:DUF6607 family protein [Arenimonas donghaensis]KFL35755.1 hypothetical protein N788_06840 [Arenimonas donghaensis DSM 18148 = HO3-R19]